MNTISNIFYQERNSNFYDNIVVDVKKIYRKFPINRKFHPKPNSADFIGGPFHKIYRNPLIPIKYRNYFWHLFRRLNLDLSWFKTFKHYWSYVLRGRPLWGIEEFFFLNNLYRVKFQNIQVPDTDDPNIQLDAWQRSELIYQLLHLIYKESYSNELTILDLLRKKKKKIKSILEFGCATAPITTSYLEFFRLKKNMKIFISDIQTIAFHYATYKFRRCSNIIPLLLIPDNDFLLTLSKKVDVIFCMAVFEHLNKPLATINKFYEYLNKDGFLLFDFIKTEGEGLDTHHAVKERNGVLEYIAENFDIIHGKIIKDKDLGLTIVRKK